ncbi:uncharacterized protein LOC135227077 [Macrobrachium nipponense]|uniref:uncharacterized protein LOC135227077 n=1 Tax=Macrobrachium nipponense TaxID=159736 RepID=UPI0030C88249
MWGLVTLVWIVGVASSVPVEDDAPLVRVARQQPIYGITHLDIRDAILTLEKVVKDVTNKLNRHEAREAQVADFTTKTLNALNSDHSLVEKSMQAVARQLTKMEERLLSIESLIQTTDERQRMMLNRMSQSMDRFLSQDPNSHIPPPPPLDFPLSLPSRGGGGGGEEDEVGKNVKKIVRKLTQMDTTILRELERVSTEVQTVTESLGTQISQLQLGHDQLSASMETCERSSLEAMQQLMSRAQASGCSGGGDVPGDVSSRLDALDRRYQEQEAEIHSMGADTHRNLEETLNLLKKLVDESHNGQAVINASVADLTRNLRQLDDTTQDGLGRLTMDVQTALRDSSDALSETVSEMASQIKQETSNIMDTLDDTASQAENLQHTVLENYSELSDQIGSLKKVEKVMINTADAVLDTKRSIEFGIQQIILELGEIVKSSGSTINTTLSDQISNISFAILKNQTSALTNMTAKMEQEISQVWRQIGIMYQQMTQSVDLLDQLRNTTKLHMNASLSRVGEMDGTVGQINTKVADVEDNLNYLLGRLSLVVSEFNLMKAGVGDELVRLRENLAKGNAGQFGYEGDEPAEYRYDISRKRHAIHSESRLQEREALPPPSYFEQNREPLTVF